MEILYIFNPLIQYMVFNFFLSKINLKLRIIFLSFCCFIYSTDVSSQSLSSKVEIDGGSDMFSFASVLLNGSVYLHAYDYDFDISHNYFYKVDARGNVDSVLVRDFNDSITYMFRYAFVEGDFVYWLGVYDFPQFQRLEPKGYAVIKTDSSLQIVDRLIVPHSENVSLWDYFFEDGTIYLSLSESSRPLHLWRLWISVVNTSGGLSLVKDTIYSVSNFRSGSLVKVRNNLVIPLQNSPFIHSVDLSDFSYLGIDTLRPSGTAFANYGVNNMAYYQDTLLISSHHFSESYMLHDLDFNLLDTFQITNHMTGLSNNFHSRGADFVSGMNYFYGGVMPAISLIDFTKQGDLRLFKIHNFSHEWDCLISDDSTNKIITSMFPSDDGSVIYLVYNEYDHRKGNLQRNVVVTTMDTMCNVLSTSKISLDDYFVQLYPNPTTEGVTFSGAANDTYILEFFSISGQKKLSVSQVHSDTYIPLSGFASGIYLVKVKSEKHPSREKVLKVVVK